jgi:hypothetical protein
MKYLIIILSFLGGAVTAVFYIRLLYNSLKELTDLKRPVLSAAFGYALRIGLCAACFLAAALAGGINALASAAAGFFITRAMAVRHYARAMERNDN